MDGRCFAFLVGSLTAGGCAGAAVQPPGAEVLVVQSVLTTASSSQAIWIERLASGIDPMGGELRPLATPPSRVEVRDTAGGVFTFIPDPQSSARFLSSFTPVPGMRYELFIDVLAGTIHGSVLVPLPLVIEQPSADTVTISLGDTLHVEWTSGSSRDFAWVQTAEDSATAAGSIPLAVTTRDSTLVLPAILFQVNSVVWAMALDHTAARFFDVHGFGKGASENLSGAIGVFGAMVVDRVHVHVN